MELRIREVDECGGARKRRSIATEIHGNKTHLSEPDALATVCFLAVKLRDREILAVRLHCPEGAK